jgi:catechol 2,3-dioxygenase-like lactoylglutathione lyase family enzyme
VDDFWQSLTGQGFRDDGAPGLREKYRRGYYGAFVLDPDDNSIEAVHKEGLETNACVDHVWLRVRDVAASRAFYDSVGAVLGFELSSESATHASFRGDRGWFTVTSPDETWSVSRTLSEHAHVAFPAADRAAVEEFHRVALASGYADNEPPGERGRHSGSFAASVLDPDGNTVEAVVRERAV